MGNEKYRVNIKERGMKSLHLKEDIKFKIKKQRKFILKKYIKYKIKK